jgi:hypothetical protein
MGDYLRIYEIARRLGVLNQDVIYCLRELGYDAKSHSSRIDSTAANRVTASIAKKRKQGWEGMNRPVPSKKKNKKGGNDDSDTWQGSPVPKMPYPVNDSSAVSLPLPKGGSADDADRTD